MKHYSENKKNGGGGLAATAINDTLLKKHTMATEIQWLEQAQMRFAMTDLLANLFRNEVDYAILKTLRTSDMIEALNSAGMDLDTDFMNKPVKLLADELAIDFTQLFLLPGHLISPHESVQTQNGSKILRGPETARVKNYYENIGFNVVKETFMEADHLSIELEFLAHLAQIEVKAWNNNNSQQALNALRYQDDFYNVHLGHWIYDFLTKVESKSQTHFYQELARMTGDFLSEQQSQIHDMIDAITKLE